MTSVKETRKISASGLTRNPEDQQSDRESKHIFHRFWFLSIFLRCLIQPLRDMDDVTLAGFLDRVYYFSERIKPENFGDHLPSEIYIALAHSSEQEIGLGNIREVEADLILRLLLPDKKTSLKTTVWTALYLDAEFDSSSEGRNHEYHLNRSLVNASSLFLQQLGRDVKNQHYEDLQDVCVAYVVANPHAAFRSKYITYTLTAEDLNENSLDSEEWQNLLNKEKENQLIRKLTITIFYLGQEDMESIQKRLEHPNPMENLLGFLELVYHETIETARKETWIEKYFGIPMEQINRKDEETFMAYTNTIAALRNTVDDQNIVISDLNIEIADMRKQITEMAEYIKKLESANKNPKNRIRKNRKRRAKQKKF